MDVCEIELHRFALVQNTQSTSTTSAVISCCSAQCPPLAYSVNCKATDDATKARSRLHHFRERELYSGRALISITPSIHPPPPLKPCCVGSGSAVCTRSVQFNSILLVPDKRKSVAVSLNPTQPNSPTSQTHLSDDRHFTSLFSAYYL